MIALFIDKTTKQAWTRVADKIRIPKDAAVITVFIGDVETELALASAVDTKSKLVIEDAKKNQKFVSVYLGIDANNDNILRVRYAGEDAVDGNLEFVADETTSNAQAITGSLATNVGVASELLPANDDSEDDEKPTEPIE